MNTNLILCRLLSFTSLAIGWLAARILKFYLYNIEGFGMVWNVKPVPFSSEFSFFIHTVLGQHILILGVALILDKLVWPIFFRDEVAELKAIQQSN